MANPNPKHKFQKGEVTNPKGRAPNPPELKALQRMTKMELEVLMHKILNTKPEDLNNFNGTVLEKFLASILFHGIKNGDYGRLNPFLERLFGKVKEEIVADVGFKIVIEDYSKK